MKFWVTRCGWQPLGSGGAPGRVLTSDHDFDHKHLSAGAGQGGGDGSAARTCPFSCWRAVLVMLITAADAESWGSSTTAAVPPAGCAENTWVGGSPFALCHPAAPGTCLSRASQASCVSCIAAGRRRCTAAKPNQTGSKSEMRTGLLSSIPGQSSELGFLSCSEQSRGSFQFSLSST